MSKFLLRKGPFIYKTLFPEIEDQALTLSAQEHVKYEPLDAYLKTSEEVCRNYFLNCLSSGNSRELSIVCIHEPTQELCGVSINKSTDSEKATKTSDLASFVGPIEKIMEDLSQEFVQNNKEILKHGFCVADVTVPKVWSGNRIGNHLFYASFEYAKQLGYRFAIIECTGPVSQHIVINHFKPFVLKTIVYKDFVFNGVKAFEYLDGDIKLCLVTF